MNISAVSLKSTAPSGIRHGERLASAQARLEESQAERGSRGVGAQELAAYREYAGAVSTDIASTLSVQNQAVLEIPPDDPFFLTEPPDPSVTPRYQPIARYDQQSAELCQGCPGYAGRRSDAQQAARTVVGRLLQMMDVAGANGRPLQLDGVTPVTMFLHDFLNNPAVSDDMLVKMGSVELQDLARTPERQANIEERQPGCRDLITHRMAVALISALTGIPPKILSKQCPDLGLSGTPGWGLWIPGSECELGAEGDPEDYQLGNILHDTTDFLQGAGIGGLNLAIWGEDSSEWSAAESWDQASRGDRYPEED